MRSTFLAAFAAALTLAVPAAAHVTANPSQAPADSYFQTSLRVPHGCNGSATIAIRVKLPEGVSSVKPQMKAGWTIEIKMRKLDEPIDAGHGRMVTELVDEISWRGGLLPDAYYDDFGIQVRMPAVPGKTLYFPTVQECEQGVSRWIEIPTAGQNADELKLPAPAITLIERR